MTEPTVTAATMTAAEFHAARRFAAVGANRIAYVEQGRGPVALFLHGVPLNGFHWRHAMAAMGDMRRCVALDLMGLGYSEIAPGQDVSFTAQAEMVRGFVDALGLDQVDLVANDSGGAVAQIFAAHHPRRLRSLTLTNCDVHDGWPPPSIQPLIDAAREGRLADRYAALRRDPAGLRRQFADAYADPRALTDEAIAVYFDPLLATPARREAFHRYWLGFDPAHTVAVEPLLRKLRVPTLIVWALDDVFFGRAWAEWLAQTIPGVAAIVDVPRARLFFAEDRPQSLVAPLRRFLGEPAAAAPNPQGTGPASR